MEAMVSSLMSPFLLLPKPLSVHGGFQPVKLAH